MNNNRPTCDDATLETMLRQNQHSEPSDELLSHLESCPRCQQRISELAGSNQMWLGVKFAISESTEDEPQRSIPPLATDPSAIHWTESVAKQLLSPPTHPEMLGRLGRYEVERLIGSGGMGVVFKAFDTELNRPVAIKLLSPYLASSGPARKRFSREARAAAAVVHQHVVPIHNVETGRDPPFIVMQYVSGESFQSRIDRDGPLELCEILRIGMQVAEGLSAAHQQGLVHRDIKPSNILLEEAIDRALISDFGLARAADDASLTRTGFHPGTPQYMSPEQAAGQRVDTRSDLFSLGSTLYTMCTGRPPFRAENSLGVLRRIADDDPTPIREVNSKIPQWLERLVGKLMAKREDDRPESAALVANLLQLCLAHIEQPHSVSLPDELCNHQGTSTRRTKRNLILLTSATAVTAILAWIGMGLWMHETTQLGPNMQTPQTGKENKTVATSEAGKSGAGTSESDDDRDQAVTLPVVDVLELLENGELSATMPKGLVIRVGACMGEPTQSVPEDAQELVELWEFTPDYVHRVKRFLKDGKPAYVRLESRKFDSSGLCTDLLDGRAFEIHEREGTGPETVLEGTDYGRGSRAIELEWNGQTILDLYETNGPTFDAYRESDAKTFASLYERLAKQARSSLGPEVGETSTLEWQKSGILKRLGDTPPLEDRPKEIIEMHQEKPAGLKSVPVGLISPRFGEFRLGPPDCAVSVFVIVDSPAGYPATMFVDRNADGEMVNEKECPMVPRKTKLDDGTEPTRHETQLTIDVPFPEGKRPMDLNLFRVDPRRYSGYELFIVRESDFGYTGTTKINGKPTPTVVLDMGGGGESKTSDRDYRNWTRIWFDLNLDGKRNENELVVGQLPFLFDDQWWQVLSVGYDGTIRVIQSTPPSQPFEPNAF